MADKHQHDTTRLATLPGESTRASHLLVTVRGQHHLGGALPVHQRILFRYVAEHLSFIRIALVKAVPGSNDDPILLFPLL